VSLNEGVVDGDDVDSAVLDALWVISKDCTVSAETGFRFVLTHCGKPVALVNRRLLRDIHDTYDSSNAAEAVDSDLFESVSIVAYLRDDARHTLVSETILNCRGGVLAMAQANAVRLRRRE
jgi:hypothetical protein